MPTGTACWRIFYIAVLNYDVRSLTMHYCLHNVIIVSTLLFSSTQQYHGFVVPCMTIKVACMHVCCALDEDLLRSKHVHHGQEFLQISDLSRSVWYPGRYTLPNTLTMQGTVGCHSSHSNWEGEWGSKLKQLMNSVGGALESVQISF